MRLPLAPVGHCRTRGRATWVGLSDHLIPMEDRFSDSRLN
jgi:hypothetical protein